MNVKLDSPWLIIFADGKTLTTDTWFLGRIIERLPQHVEVLPDVKSETIIVVGQFVAIYKGD